MLYLFRKRNSRKINPKLKLNQIDGCGKKRRDERPETAPGGGGDPLGRAAAPWAAAAG
jgi:hypothetical protein